MSGVSIAACVETVGRPSVKNVLACLAAQSVRPDELIVLADGRSVLDKWRVFASAAKSDYVLIIDDDIAFGPDWVESFRVHAERGADFVCGPEQPFGLRRLVGIGLYRRSLFAEFVQGGVSSSLGMDLVVHECLRRRAAKVVIDPRCGYLHVGDLSRTRPELREAFRRYAHGRVEFLKRYPDAFLWYAAGFVESLLGRGGDDRWR